MARPFDLLTAIKYRFDALSKHSQAVPGPDSDPRLARKAREQLRRQQDILSVARDVLQRDGVAGFSMERIAEEAGYSRTAVYHYFPSKEDVIMALAIETTELRLQLQDRVRHFDARPRERMVALGEVTAVLYPVHVVAEVIAYANAVRIKTSDELQQQLRDLDHQEDAVNVEVIAEAVECGDLSLPRGIRLHELRYVLDTFGRGIFSSIATATPFEELDIPDPRVLLRKVGVHFLDGLQWQPLSSEWDYSRTMRRIYSEVFPAGLPLLSWSGIGPTPRP